MRRFPWLIAAMLMVPAAGWCQQSNPPGGQAQDQSAASDAPAKQHDSLADAARKTREAKKEGAKAAKVFTNDDLPAAGGISTVGKENSATAGAAASDNTAAATGTTTSASDEKSWRAKFAELRHKLEQDQGELDVMQRELGVLNLQSYNDPVKAMQQNLTRSDINKKTSDIDKKKKEVADDQQAITDAEDQLRKSGGDSGWAR